MQEQLGQHPVRILLGSLMVQCQLKQEGGIQIASDTVSRPERDPERKTVLTVFSFFWKDCSRPG